MVIFGSVFGLGVILTSPVLTFSPLRQFVSKDFPPIFQTSPQEPDLSVNDSFAEITRASSGRKCGGDTDGGTKRILLFSVLENLKGLLRCGARC